MIDNYEGLKKLDPVNEHYLEKYQKDKVDFLKEYSRTKGSFQIIADYSRHCVASVDQFRVLLQNAKQDYYFIFEYILDEIRELFKCKKFEAGIDLAKMALQHIEKLPIKDSIFFQRFIFFYHFQIPILYLNLYERDLRKNLVETKRKLGEGYTIIRGTGPESYKQYNQIIASLTSGFAAVKRLIEQRNFYYSSLYSNFLFALNELVNDFKFKQSDRVKVRSIIHEYIELMEHTFKISDLFTIKLKEKIFKEEREIQPIFEKRENEIFQQMEHVTGSSRRIRDIQDVLQCYNNMENKTNKDRFAFLAVYRKQVAIDSIKETIDENWLQFARKIYQSIDDMDLALYEKAILSHFIGIWELINSQEQLPHEGAVKRIVQ